MPPAANRSNASTLTQEQRRRLRAAVVVCAAAFGAALSSAPAQAAPLGAAADAAASQPQSWAKAYAQGQWSAAVELLETIPESSRTAWHWLHLARALEHGAQLVEAFAAYERVHELAADRRGGAGMRDVARQAKLESHALSNRIPWAEVALARGLPAGALVFIDQQWLEPGRLRSPYPVNPGWHTFLVESNGEVLAARRAFFEEGQTRVVPLTLLDPELSMAAASVAGDAALSGARATSPRSLTWHPDEQRRLDTPRDAEHDADPDRGGLLRASYVSLGVGALGTLVGTGFLVTALNARGEGRDYGTTCFSSSCEADALRANRNWRARTSAATASYAIGLAGLITGGVLYLLHRDSSARSATVNIADLSLELAPRFSPHGAMLRGTF